jgi:hypothetical protein
MTHKLYEPNAKLLVLSADSFNQTVSPEAQINHVFCTKIYGDGRMVFADPAKGDFEIFEGRLDVKQISHIFELLQARGFFGFADHYFEPVLGGTTTLITATRRSKPTKSISCYGPQSAPLGFAECFEALLYPHIHPTSVTSYLRKPITRTDLHQGWYWGFEYQKKLDTPIDWVWIDAGKSSKWSKPVSHTVILDSSYMIPPVGNCRHIRVQYSDNPASDGSTIQFDRNGMSPNQFGDIGISTKMYCMPQPATCTLLETEGDERLFSVAVPGYTGAHLRLVVFGDLAKPRGGRLLEVNDHNVIQNIHWLQAAPQPRSAEQRHG